MSHSPKRLGFSFFELLVILVIVVMAIALLVPAILKARESAARAQRTNNLKQVCLGTHSYHSANKRFPAASAAAEKDKAILTVSVHLLPYLEQSPLYGIIFANDNKAPTDVRIGTYNVAEDISTTDWVRVQNFAANVRIFTDGGFGTAWDKTVALKTSMPCATTIAQITDGTSNTIMFSTRYAASGTVSAKGQSETPCGYYDLPLANNGGSFFGATPMTGKVSATSTSGWQLAPTLAQVNCAAAVGMSHAFDNSGLMVGLCDGSVRMIAPGISSRTWNAAMCPNDANPLGSDW